jgi:hypothetical protein
MTRSAILLNPKLKPQQETEMHKLKTYTLKHWLFF